MNFNRLIRRNGQVVKNNAKPAIRHLLALAMTVVVLLVFNIQYLFAADSIERVTDESEMMYGIDVSRWQGDIDWAQVKKSGVQFAFIKCGGGDDGLYEDSCFEKNIKGAIDNGIYVGVYFFSDAHTVDEAKQEAEFCLELIRGYDLTLPVAYDWEREMDGHSVEEITQTIETFCDIMKENNYDPMVYSNRNRWYNYFNAGELVSRYKAWVACYFSDYYYTDTQWSWGDDIASFEYDYGAWQYGVSNQGVIPGIDYACDVDIALKSILYSNADTDKTSGDCNSDGCIDEKDLAIMKRYLAGFTDTDISLKDSDVNGDGVTDITDVVILTRFLAGYNETLEGITQ